MYANLRRYRRLYVTHNHSSILQLLLLFFSYFGGGSSSLYIIIYTVRMEKKHVFSCKFRLQCYTIVIRTRNTRCRERLLSRKMAKRLNRRVITTPVYTYMYIGNIVIKGIQKIRFIQQMVK